LLWKNDGRINLSTTGGTMPYVCMHGQKMEILANTENLSNLSPGDYKVTITEANGCDTLETYTIMSLNIKSDFNQSGKYFMLWRLYRRN
jgi:hypothetical protein